MNAPIMPRLLLKLMAPRPMREPSLEQPAQEPLHLHLVRLEAILQQVNKDGFHVEYIRSLSWENATTDEVVAAVNRWAGRAGLKVSLNLELGIFFFEQ